MATSTWGFTSGPKKIQNEDFYNKKNRLEVAELSIVRSRPLQALAAGKFEAVEKRIREVFKEEIGANTVEESTDLKDGISWNNHKGVFQATVKLPDQAILMFICSDIFCMFHIYSDHLSQELT